MRLTEVFLLPVFWVPINTTNSEYVILRDAMPNTLFVDSRPGSWHHKYIILDPNCPDGNPRIYTGSANWSNNGNLRSDENIVIVHDADIANVYYQSFMNRYHENGGTLVVDGQCEIETPNSITSFQPVQSLIKIYPNPAQGLFYAENMTTESQKVFISDISGRVIYQLSDINPGLKKEFNLNVAAGIYFISMTGTESKISQTYKLLIQ
jgi:hypothetical protein